MDRALPEYNRVIHEKKLHDMKVKHVERIRTVSHVVDNKIPTAYKFPGNTAKKDLMIEQRCQEIEKNNRMLLRKMEGILTGKATHEEQYAKKYNPHKSLLSSKFSTEGGTNQGGRWASTSRSKPAEEKLTKAQRLQAEEDALLGIDIINESPGSQPRVKVQDGGTGACYPKPPKQKKPERFSLNKVSQDHEMKRIMQENEALLRRLQSRESNYNVDSWVRDRRKQERQIRKLCKYEPSISTAKSFQNIRRARRRTKERKDLMAMAAENNFGLDGNADVPFGGDNLSAEDHYMYQYSMDGKRQSVDKKDLHQQVWLDTHGPNQQVYYQQLSAQQSQNQQEETEGLDNQDINDTEVNTEGVAVTSMLPNTTNNFFPNQTGSLQGNSRISINRNNLIGTSHVNKRQQINTMKSSLPEIQTKNQMFSQRNLSTQGGTFKNFSSQSTANRNLMSQPAASNEDGQPQLNCFSPKTESMPAQRFIKSRGSTKINPHGLMSNTNHLNFSNSVGGFREQNHLASSSTKGAGNPQDVIKFFKGKKAPQPMQIKNSLFAGSDQKRKVLYRNFHNISGIIYLVEISRTAKKVYIILFPNFEKPDIFIYEALSDKIFQKLMSDQNFQFIDFLATFKIKYSKLWIEGYHGHPIDPRKVKTVQPVRASQDENMYQSQRLANLNAYGNQIQEEPNEIEEVAIDSTDPLVKHDDNTNNNDAVNEQIAEEQQQEEFDESQQNNQQILVDDRQQQQQQAPSSPKKTVFVLEADEEENEAPEETKNEQQENDQQQEEENQE